MKALFTFLFLTAALVLLPASPGRAEVYRYTDKKGTVHYTDDPDQLPEPQRSKVLQELEEKIRKAEEQRRKRKEQGLEVPDERLPPPPPPRPASNRPHPSAKRLEDNRASRKAWEARADKARERVAELEKKCAELKEDRDRNKTDSLTFSRPGANQRYQKALAAHQKCQEELKTARNFLEVELPEQARKAGVPPGWIR